MTVELTEAEQRRAPRVPGDFWVMVQGVDAQLVLRRGNVSATGIIFGADELELDVGCLEYLHVMSLDKSVGVMAMAQVARIVAFEGGPSGVSHRAVAFEFMPENAARRAEIERLVNQVAQQDPPQKREPQPAQGQVFSLEIPRMRFETSWPVDVGDRIQIVLRRGVGASRIPFEGYVQAVHGPTDGPLQRYVVDATPMRAGQRSPGLRSITESIDLVMAELMTQSATGDLAGERPHLKGRLDRICLATVLSWFDVGRLSGRLRVSGPADEPATMYLRDGRIVDVDMHEQPEPLEALRTILTWPKGGFELHEGDVTRPDRLETPTGALLLELARQADEGGLSFVA